MNSASGGEVVGLEYWLQWQVGVCGLLIFVSATVALRYLLGWPDRDLRSGELWIPCWSGLHPTWLLVYRASAFTSTAFVLYKVVVELRGLLAFYFYTHIQGQFNLYPLILWSFLRTQLITLSSGAIRLVPSDFFGALLNYPCIRWTFALVMIYFALATILSARECWAYSKKQFPENGGTNHLLRKGSKLKDGTKRLHSRYSREEIEQKAGFLGHLIQAIYQTCAGASMQTDIVFWCLLYPFFLPKDFQMNYTIWCTHGLNAILLILDSALNSQPFHWHGFAYYVLWSASYITFQWVLHACCFTWWPYPFLELSTPSAPLWYFGMALIHVPCFGVYVLLIKGKGYIFSKMFPHAFIRSLKTTKMKSLDKKQT